MLGLKHADPTIEAAVDRPRRAGRSDASSALVLAPHYSAFSVGQYLDRVAGRGRPHGVARHRRSRAGRPSRRSSTSSPASCAGAWRTMPANTQGGVHRPLAAAAHRRRRRSVPGRAARHRRGGRRRGRARGWSGGRIAWQSRRPHTRAVAGPDILPSSTDLGRRAEHADGVLVCACGFVADHLEVLYDLDIEARARRRARPRVRPHRVRQRRPRGDRRAGRSGRRPPVSSQD